MRRLVLIVLATLALGTVSAPAAEAALGDGQWPAGFCNFTESAENVTTPEGAVYGVASIGVPDNPGFECTVIWSDVTTSHDGQLDAGYGGNDASQWGHLVGWDFYICAIEPGYYPPDTSDPNLWAYRRLSSDPWQNGYTDTPISPTCPV
jgi:hypothetical protein